MNNEVMQLSKDLAVGLVFYDEEKDKLYVQYERAHNFLLSEMDLEKGKEHKYNTLFYNVGEKDIKRKKDTIKILLNACYKYINYKPLTDLEEQFRNDIGYYGNTFIRDLYESMDERKKINDIPYEELSELTIGNIYSKDVLKKVKQP